MTKMRDHKQVLLGVLFDYAPDARAQEVCAQIVNVAELAGASPTEMDEMLVGMIGDGIKYGNWPWITGARGWPPLEQVMTLSTSYPLAPSEAAVIDG